MIGQKLIKMHSKLNIRTKLLMAFSLLLLFVVGAGLSSAYFFNQIEIQADHMQEASTLSYEISDTLKQSIHKIQYLMTNASFTNHASSQLKTAKWIEHFNDYISSVPAKCQGCHEKTFKDTSEFPNTNLEIRKIKSLFDQFLRNGKEMSNAYLYHGQQQGYMALSVFEESGVRLLSELDMLSTMGKDHQGISRQKMATHSELSKRLCFWGTISILVIGIIIATVSASRVSSTIGSITESADRIAKGILSDKDIEIKANDEIGMLTHSLNRMRQALHNTIAEMTGSASEVSDSSENLFGAVNSIRDGINTLSQRAESVATSTTEMSQTVLDIASNAMNIASSAESTMDTANEGAGIVSQTVTEVQKISRTVKESSELMKSLGQRSNQIGEIINVINEIADQTNLLALNAAIEAARAGEQGRGFAVVADEVRKLAERTSRATTEISGMIESIQSETGMAVKSMTDSQHRVETGTELAGQAEQSLNRILDSIKGLLDKVQLIASSTEEMSSTSEMISEELESIAVDAHKADATTESIASSSNDLSALAHRLKTLSDKFKT